MLPESRHASREQLMSASRASPVSSSGHEAPAVGGIPYCRGPSRAIHPAKESTIERATCFADGVECEAAN
jgi:hypothetical protein